MSYEFSVINACVYTNLTINSVVKIIAARCSCSGVCMRWRSPLSRCTSRPRIPNPSSLYQHIIKYCIGILFFCTCVCSYVRAHDGACAVASPVHVSSVMTSHREHRQTRTYTNMHVQIHTYIHTHPRIHSYIHINIHTNVTCDRTPHPRDHQGVWSPFLSHL